MKFKNANQRKAVMAKIRRLPKTSPLMYIQKPLRIEEGYWLGVVPVDGKPVYCVEDRYTISQFPNKAEGEKEFKENIKISRQVKRDTQ